MNIIQKTITGILLIGVGFFAGRYEFADPVHTKNVVAEKNPRTFTAPFTETWVNLHEQFIGTLDDAKLNYGAVAGMVQAAGDPYTSFFNPEQTKQLKETLRGSFSGIGAEMGVQSGFVVVIAPLEGSPAQRAGIKSGDIVVSVDKKNITQDMSLDDVVKQIRGVKGTPVVLGVIHKGETTQQDISVIRDDIAVPSVKLEVKNNIAHITLSSFNSDSSDQFIAIARQIQKQRVRGVVLDMRDNPGGYLDSAVEIASQFLEPGKEVVSEQGKSKQTHVSRGVGLLRGVPVVVLINHGSASASEILAGALHDQLNAPVVGAKSFGKGSVQEVLDISDGSSLKVTIAKWYTPKGTSIDKEGITPTVVIEDDEKTPADEQLDRAYQEIK